MSTAQKDEGARTREGSSSSRFGDDGEGSGLVPPADAYCARAAKEFGKEGR